MGFQRDDIPLAGCRDRVLAGVRGRAPKGNEAIKKEGQRSSKADRNKI